MLLNISVKMDIVIFLFLILTLNSEYFVTFCIITYSKCMVNIILAVVIVCYICFIGCCIFIISLLIF